MEENLPKIINIIENHLKNGNIQESLDLIHVELKKSSTVGANKLLKRTEILIGRFGYLQRNIQDGVISQPETNLEYNKILKSVVGLKQELKRDFEKENQVKSKFSKKKLIIWFIPVFLGFVFFIYKSFEKALNEISISKSLGLYKENNNKTILPNEEKKLDKNIDNNVCDLNNLTYWNIIMDKTYFLKFYDKSGDKYKFIAYESAEHITGTATLNGNRIILSGSFGNGELLLSNGCKYLTGYIKGKYEPLAINYEVRY